MKKLILRSLLLVAFLPLFSVHAQYKPYYSWAFGLRAGSVGATTGFTVKTFLAPKSALEGIIGYTNGGLAGTILFEQHIELFNKKELQAYFGGGLHYTSRSGFDNYTELNSRTIVYQDGKQAAGADLVLGISYKFPTVPIAFSLDVKPMYEFNELGNTNSAFDTSLGIKLAF